MAVLSTLKNPITNSEEYWQSIRDMNLPIWAFGEKITNVVDHPLFTPHIKAVAKTYELAPTATSHLSGKTISRFNHIHQNTDDLLKKVKMLRMLNQHTACCIQRCAGTDAMNAAYIVTYELDKKYGTNYHERFKTFLTYVQEYNVVVLGAMTDVKGDRTKYPHELSDPDLYVHVTKETDEGIYVTGAKAHFTGPTSGHMTMVFPSRNMKPQDADYAVVFACALNTPGITYVYGRQTNDSRKCESGTIDRGNQYATVGGESLMIFDNVFIPWEDVFMYKETEFCSTFVEVFATAHRQNYGACKGGICDVLLGAVYGLCKSNGIEKVGHVKDKIADMINLTETLYAGSIACSCEGRKSPSGAYYADTMLGNITKHNTTKFIYEINRLSHDLVGGILATLPSESDFNNETIGPLLHKYFAGTDAFTTEEKCKLIRLVECLTGGTACVEAMHGAGPPQAQKIMMLRDANLEGKLKLAERLLGIHQ